MADEASASQLHHDYNILLVDSESGSWTQEHAYRLLETMKSVPQKRRDPYKEQSLPASKWLLTSDHLEDDIQIAHHEDEDYRPFSFPKMPSSMPAPGSPGLKASEASTTHNVCTTRWCASSRITAGMKRRTKGFSSRVTASRPAYRIMPNSPVPPLASPRRAFRNSIPKRSSIDQYV